MLISRVAAVAAARVAQGILASEAAGAEAPVQPPRHPDHRGGEQTTADQRVAQALLRGGEVMVRDPRAEADMCERRVVLYERMIREDEAVPADVHKWIRRVAGRVRGGIAPWHHTGAVNTCAWIVFLDESGVSLLPQIRRTYSPRGRAPLLRRLNWKRASMAGALGYYATDPDRGARLCFHLKPGSYDAAKLIEVLEQMKVFYRGERVVLVWDGPSAHWSRAVWTGSPNRTGSPWNDYPPTLPS
ncbi:transposase [Streptomyces sp. NRRL S-340]|uniref:transposase n=1 Tax=Streptomyces sp. NRRL S-340 TaxID=1463901 RepID=UPI001F19955C|nr:transposase [Streptomyces sp. NRRL S-340]